MRRFVAEQNIRHFNRILEGDLDPCQRALVRNLLAEANQEFAEAQREFEELENAARLRDPDTLPIANDECDQQGTQRSPSARRR